MLPAYHHVLPDGGDVVDAGDVPPVPLTGQTVNSEHLLGQAGARPEVGHAVHPRQVASRATLHLCGQGVDITIPVTCSVFEPDPMTSQCTRGVPWLKFRHKIHKMWVIFSSVAIASQ